jgi:hypothetical protein
MALLDHESINTKEGMKIWEAKDKLKFPEIMSWNDFDRIVTERVLWTRLSNVPLPSLYPSPTIEITLMPPPLRTRCLGGIIYSCIEHII